MCRLRTSVPFFHTRLRCRSAVDFWPRSVKPGRCRSTTLPEACATWSNKGYEIRPVSRPRLAAQLYGGEILAANIEDHRENFTRFHLLCRAADAAAHLAGEPNKLSIAFSVEHRPGTLVRALEGLANAGANLTKIESRPVQGRPWEYVFFAELRYEGEAMADAVLRSLASHASFVRELGRYPAA